MISSRAAGPLVYIFLRGDEFIYIGRWASILSGNTKARIAPGSHVVFSGSSRQRDIETLHN